VTARRIAGVVAPVPTPFDSRTEDVDFAAFRRNVVAVLEAGADGIVVAGSTGENAVLTPEELRELAAVGREMVPASRGLVVGSGAESTRAARALTHIAAEEGADAVLVRPPGYFGRELTRDALGGYYRAVAEASPVPVFAYNIPRYTGVALAPELLAELAASGHLAGVKDSSGDVSALSAYRRALPGQSVFVGSAALLLAALELGCQGGILAVACFAPRLCKAVWDAFARGDLGAATAHEARLGPLQEVVTRYGPPGVKAAMEIAGFEGGACRSPLVPLTARDLDHVRQLLGA